MFVYDKSMFGLAKARQNHMTDKNNNDRKSYFTELNSTLNELVTIIQCCMLYIVIAKGFGFIPFYAFVIFI